MQCSQRACVASPFLPSIRQQQFAGIKSFSAHTKRPTSLINNRFSTGLDSSVCSASPVHLTLLHILSCRGVARLRGRRFGISPLKHLYPLLIPHSPIPGRGCRGKSLIATSKGLCSHHLRVHSCLLSCAEHCMRCLNQIGSKGSLDPKGGPAPQTGSKSKPPSSAVDPFGSSSSTRTRPRSSPPPAMAGSSEEAEGGGSGVGGQRARSMAMVTEGLEVRVTFRCGLCVFLVLCLELVLDGLQKHYQQFS